MTRRCVGRTQEKNRCFNQTSIGDRCYLHSKKQKCPEYQKACKGVNDVWNIDCSVNKSRETNKSIREKASECGRLREANRVCRIKNNLPVDDGHSAAIERMRVKVQKCRRLLIE